MELVAILFIQFQTHKCRDSCNALILNGARLSCFTLVYNFSSLLLAPYVYFFCCANSDASWSLFAKMAESLIDEQTSNTFLAV